MGLGHPLACPFFFVRAKTVFGARFGAFLVFGYYLDMDFLMFFRSGFSDVIYIRIFWCFYISSHLLKPWWDEKSSIFYLEAMSTRVVQKRPEILSSSPPKFDQPINRLAVSDRGWLHPQSCSRSERFSTVSGDGPDFGQILISPLKSARDLER